MIRGKGSDCMNEGFERRYCFEKEEGKSLDIRLRVYENGVVLRYEINSIGEKEYVVDEYRGYNIGEGGKRWMQE